MTPSSPQSPQSPPKRLTLTDCLKYLKEKNIDVSRQTVYNWMNVGVNKTTLRYATVKAPLKSKSPTIRITTTEWIDDFLHSRGV